MSDAFQDHYPKDFAHCYGCGYLNEHGLQIKSRWEGDVAVCRFQPRPWHTAFIGYVYGGLIASLIDCHAMGTASPPPSRSTISSPLRSTPNWKSAHTRPKWESVRCSSMQSLLRGVR